MQKSHMVQCDWNETSRIGKSIDGKQTKWLPRAAGRGVGGRGGGREGGDTANGEEALSGRDDNVLKLDSDDDCKAKYLNTTDFYTLKEGILWYRLCLNKAVVKKKN